MSVVCALECCFQNATLSGKNNLLRHWAPCYIRCGRVVTDFRHYPKYGRSLLKPLQNKKGQNNLGYLRKKQYFYLEKDCFFLGYPKLSEPSYFEVALSWWRIRKGFVMFPLPPMCSASEVNGHSLSFAWQKNQNKGCFLIRKPRGFFGMK